MLYSIGEKDKDDGDEVSGITIRVCKRKIQIMNGRHCPCISKRVTTQKYPTSLNVRLITCIGAGSNKTKECSDQSFR